MEGKSNSDLVYIIRYTDKKNEAAEQLLKQSPSNSNLVSIICYTDKKNEAWEQLLKQSPSNFDLVYIILFSDKKNEAAELLRKNFGINEVVDQEALISEIASIVLENPKKLKMNQWHCGTSHCIGGWACIINPIAKKIESQSDTKTAALAVLPNYSHLFFKDNATVLNFFKEKIKPN